MPELNLDGLVGPTHNYAGLSYGNVASARNQGAASAPRGAVLQGLAKMEAVAALGIVQGVLPPHERPHLPTLRARGFSGSDADVLSKAAKEDPVLLARASSASAMWTANAATVVPAADASDGRTHLVVANLREMAHRAIEPPVTARALRAVFPDRARFEVHEALPADTREDYGDEGAANHTRLTRSAASGGEAEGVHFFVYGASAESARRPAKFPARQTLSASERVADLSMLGRARCVFTQQNVDAIDAGVFHNDVIAVGNGNLLLCHELAFEDREGTHAMLRNTVGPELVIAEVSAAEMPLEDAVRSYLFNSQLLTLPDASMALVAPLECAENPRVKAVIDRLLADPAVPLARAVFMDVRESMRNGGGPACLRLRVPVTERDLAAMNRAVLVDAEKLSTLRAWATRFYREALLPTELADPLLLRESRDALDELTRILALGPIYDFQR
ncbi:MAG: N-succinylarginine dihydrolase [Planctomycetaceae bacterium]|nr:N-succinylarginine dihydrolase [Planctomycetaceae bacterium]